MSTPTIQHDGVRENLMRAVSDSQRVGELRFKNRLMDWVAQIRDAGHDTVTLVEIARFVTVDEALADRRAAEQKETVPA